MSHNLCLTIGSALCIIQGIMGSSNRSASDGSWTGGNASLATYEIMGFLMKGMLIFSSLWILVNSVMMLISCVEKLNCGSLAKIPFIRDLPLIKFVPLSLLIWTLPMVLIGYGLGITYFVLQTYYQYIF